MATIANATPSALLISAIRRRIKQLIGVQVRASGLTPAQFWVLNRVYEREGLSLRELAESLYMDAPTASRVVSTLVRAKLVRTEADSEDRRRTRIIVSARGRTLAAKLHVHAKQTRASVEAPLSASERDTLRALLTKALNHVSKQ